MGSLPGKRDHNSGSLGGENPGEFSKAGPPLLSETPQKRDTRL